MTNEIFKTHRKSFMQIGEIYFWTATINKWQHLLYKDNYKDIIINSLAYLSKMEKIDVFAFVIMPNHIHFIWRLNSYNGKETPSGSFLKYTAHEFKSKLKREDKEQLINYRINTNNKKYEFWQRDSLAVHLYTPEVAWQKLDYIHANPVAEHWQLVDEPWDYKYSTAKYYEFGIKEYDFIKDLRDEFN